MFGKIFGKKQKIVSATEESAPAGNPLSDAVAIRASVDYTILRAAWDEYVTLKKEDPDYQYGDTTPTPCWKALEKLSSYGGSFMRFGPGEANLLQALRTGFMIYDDVMHVLIDHHDDARALADLAAKYPDLMNHMPPGTAPNQIIDVMIEVVRDYQWQLEHFGMEYGAEIDAALDPARAGDITRRAVALPDAHAGSYAGEESKLSDAELGIKPEPSPLVAKFANSVLDKMEAMEASLAVAKGATQPKTSSVLDQEELRIALANQETPVAPAKGSSVLDQDELKKLK